MIITLQRQTLWAERVRSLGIGCFTSAFTGSLLFSGFAISSACQGGVLRDGDYYCGVALPNFLHADDIQSLIIGGMFLGSFVGLFLARATMYPWIRVRDFLMSRRTVFTRSLSFWLMTITVACFIYTAYRPFTAVMPGFRTFLILLAVLGALLFSIGDMILTRRISSAFASLNVDASVEREIYDQAQRKYAYGRPRGLRLPALFGLMVVVLPLTLYFTLKDPWWIIALLGKRSDLFEGSVGLALTLIVPLLLTALCMTAYSLARPDAGNFLENPDAKLVTLLRGFADDAKFIGGSSKKQVNEINLRELTITQGVLVAIGDPREALPRLGALRTYAKNDDWQEVFALLIERSGLVCVIAGPSNWLAWEVGQLKSTGALGRAIICFPKRSIGEEVAALDVITGATGINKSTFGPTDKLIYQTFSKNGLPVVISAEKSKHSFALGGRIALLCHRLLLAETDLSI